MITTVLPFVALGRSLLRRICLKNFLILGFQIEKFGFFTEEGIIKQ